MARTLDSWLSAYGEHHRNPTNVALHKLCVPAIVASAAGLLASSPLGLWPAGLALLLASVWWIRMAPWVGLAWLAFGTAATAAWFLAFPSWPLRGLAAGATFLVAWAGQFIGHHIEGAKPSFADDLRFLMVGPLWVLLGRTTPKGDEACASPSSES